jgi:hypothetical protein
MRRQWHRPSILLLDVLTLIVYERLDLVIAGHVTEEDEKAIDASWCRLIGFVAATASSSLAAWLSTVLILDIHA